MINVGNIYLPPCASVRTFNGKDRGDPGRIFVEVIVALAVLPLPEEGVTDDDKLIWGFVFGSDFDSHPLLSMVDYDSRGVSYGDADIWGGYSFSFETADPARYGQIEEAAQLLHSYINERIAQVNKGVDDAREAISSNSNLMKRALGFYISVNDTYPYSLTEHKYSEAVRSDKSVQKVVHGENS